MGRIDNVFGDRNLVCSCAGMEAYADAGMQKIPNEQCRILALRGPWSAVSSHSAYLHPSFRLPSGVALEWP